jgi:hypothetical protein
MAGWECQWHEGSKGIPHAPQPVEQFRSSFGVGELDPNPCIVGEALSCGLPVIFGPLTVVSEMFEDLTENY